jgi:hypothetical protein
MERLEQITRDGYQVIVQWECDTDKEILSEHQEIQIHTVDEREPLKKKDALYAGKPEAMRLHYKAWEGETIQYCDIM